MSHPESHRVLRRRARSAPSFFALLAMALVGLSLLGGRHHAPARHIDHVLFGERSRTQIRVVADRPYRGPRQESDNEAREERP